MKPFSATSSAGIRRSPRFLFGLILAFALVASACTSASTDDSTQATTEAPAGGDTASSTSAAPDTGGGDRVELNLLGWAPGGDDYWNAVEAAFEASNPQIDLIVESVPFDRYFEVQGPVIAAQAGPDIMANNAGLELFERKDSYVVLNDRYPEIADDLSSYSGACEGFDQSNDCFAVPFSTQGNVMYYNKDILAAAGLDPESPPATWDEFDAACTAIHESGKICLALGLTGVFPAFWDFPEVARNFLTEDDIRSILTGDMNWTDDKYVSILDYLSQITTRGWANEDAVSISMLPEGADLFASGQAAFAGTIISDAVNWQSFGEALGVETLGVTRWPVINADAPLANMFSGVEGSTYGITAWSENQDEAWEFLKFLASVKNAELWIEFAKGFPLNTKVNEDAFPDDPNFKTIKGIISNQTLHSGVMLAGTELDALSRGWQQVTLGQISVDEWAESMQDALEQSTKKLDG